MIWNKHLSLEGKHAFLSPSKYHWLKDTDDDLVARICNSYTADVGTLLHKEASNYIQFRYRMTKHEKRSIAVHLLSNGIPPVVLDNLDLDSICSNIVTYVNDAVGFRMSPEVILYFSEACFGTADAISYDEKNRQLRIHDLKTGVTPAKMEQLYIYTALFFLEYSYIKIADTQIELRIYQNNDIVVDNPTVDDILPIMENIRRCNNIVSQI